MTVAIQIAAAFYLDKNASSLQFSFAGCRDHLVRAGLIRNSARRDGTTNALKSFWRSLIGGGWGHHLITAAEYWLTRRSRSAMAALELKINVTDPAALRSAVGELPQNFFYYFRSDHRARAYITMKRRVMWSIGTSYTPMSTPLRQPISGPSTSSTGVRRGQMADTQGRRKRRTRVPAPAPAAPAAAPATPAPAPAAGGSSRKKPKPAPVLLRLLHRLLRLLHRLLHRLLLLLHADPQGTPA
jgi:hypothetical protein